MSNFGRWGGNNQINTFIWYSGFMSCREENCNRAYLKLSVAEKKKTQ